MQYGKIIILAVLGSSLAACAWIPPTNEEPPNLPPADVQPLQPNAPNAQDMVDSDSSVSRDDSAPVVVPPALSKAGTATTY